MEELKFVPDNMILRLFKESTAYYPHLPTTNEIKSYFRLKLIAEQKPIEAPKLGYRNDTAYLEEIRLMNPNFTWVIDKLIQDPDGISKEEKSRFLSMLGDPKYFKLSKKN